MIENFKHKGLRELFLNGVKKGIDPNHTQKLLRILDRMDASIDVQDMNLPGYRLYLLKGNKTGLWAIDISGNFRVIFRFEEGKALDVDYEDYH